MLNKEIQMERFDAGKDMQEQVRQHKEEGAGPSKLEQLLNSATTADAVAARPTSRSEEKYPEAYRGGVEEHWQQQDIQNQYDIIRTQAAAQEKVGYEEDTEKFFMDDPNHPRFAQLTPEEKLRVFGKQEQAVPLESLNGPPLVFGGLLLGISLTLIVLIYMGKLEVANQTNWYIFSGIAGAIGLMYAAQLRT